MKTIPTTMTTTTTTDHEVTIGDTTIILNSHAHPEEVAKRLSEVAGIASSWSSYSGLRVMCTQPDTIDLVSSIKRKLRAIGLPNGRSSGDLEIHVHAAQYLRCPVCGWNVTREAMDVHNASPECQLARNIAALHDEGFVEVSGSPSKAIERANVEMRWLISGMSMGVHSGGQPPKEGGVDYVRLVPSWAVTLAKCTIVPIDLRVAVIEHCGEHPAARAAILSALRLGPGRTKARAPESNDSKTEDQKKQQRTEKQRMSDLFKQALLTTG